MDIDALVIGQGKHRYYACLSRSTTMQQTIMESKGRNTMQALLLTGVRRVLSLHARYLVSILLSSSLLLSACGGSSSRSPSPAPTPPPPPAPSPNGIYSGSITGGVTGRNGSEKAIIYNNQLIVVSTDNSLQQLFNGNLTVSDTNLNDGDVDYYNNGTPKITTLTISGSFVESQSATINFSDNATTGTPIPDGTINLTRL